MFDVKYIIEDPKRIKKGIAKKHSKADIDKLVKLYEGRKETLLKVESLRARQNEVSKEIPKAKDKKTLIEEMSKVKEELKLLEPKIEQLEKQIDEIAFLVPNPTLDSVPEGKGDEDNKVIKTHGKKPTFDFTPKDHIELGKHLNIIDIERGTRASGTRFYYLKNEAVLLEFALVQHIMHKLVSKGFSPIIPPVLVKEEAMIATGFFPADRNEIYHVNPKSESNPDGDDLFLVGTAEVPLNMIHYTEILEEEKLPLRYCGFSSCFRREAGSYGKDTAGIFRVHQFDKIEMFSFCHPDKSEEEHEFLREIEEEIMQELCFR
ncbi:MAG: aminoacyl--tRNA ligase-related protein, partial [Patescibacteria group bacterium]